MIEKLDLMPEDTARAIFQDKINELIEASNRQDRLLSFLARHEFSYDLPDADFWGEMRHNG